MLNLVERQGLDGIVIGHHHVNGIKIVGYQGPSITRFIRVYYGVDVNREYAYFFGWTFIIVSIDSPHLIFEIRVPRIENIFIAWICNQGIVQFEAAPVDVEANRFRIAAFPRQHGCAAIIDQSPEVLNSANQQYQRFGITWRFVSNGIKGRDHIVVDST